MNELMKEIGTVQLLSRHDRLCSYAGMIRPPPVRPIPNDSHSILADLERRQRQLLHEFSMDLSYEVLRPSPIPPTLNTLKSATILAICGWAPSPDLSNVHYNYPLHPFIHIYLIFNR